MLLTGTFLAEYLYLIITQLDHWTFGNGPLDTPRVVMRAACGVFLDGRLRSERGTRTL